MDGGEAMCVLRRELLFPGRVGLDSTRLRCACIANQPIRLHEDVMRSGQRKNSRTRATSGKGPTKAKNKTRRSPAKALARTAEHVKKTIKPHGTRRPRPAANGSAALN